MDKINDIFNHPTIIVQCGNKYFNIPRSSIEIYKNSLLNKIIKQPLVDPIHYPLHNGRHIIKLDRTPEIFNIVMEFYIKHKIYIPYNIPYQQIYDEFDYLGLPINTSLRPTNFNNVWKTVNKTISIAEDIISMVVYSHWFKSKMENHLSFVWNVGHGYKSNEDYTNVYNMFNREDVREIVKLFIKKKFNLNSKWFTQGMINASKIKIHYFFPQTITHNKDVYKTLSIDEIRQKSLSINNHYNNILPGDSIDQPFRENSAQIALHSIRFHLNYEDTINN